MRGRDPLVALAEAAQAGDAIVTFLTGHTFAEYDADRLLSSAVERQFEIVGEAINRALRADPMLAERLPDAPAVIAFRNVLAHGYDAVSSALVWSIATEKLPALLARVRSILAENE